MHAGAHAIAALAVKAAGGQQLASTDFGETAGMEILSTLAAEFDSEARYNLLNAMANQLRYPNSHTHFFSCAILHIFSTAKDEKVQEQITRVLVERLIVHRPHPWGLLVTFIELIKNQQYRFWDKPFTRCAPEIERLFESVARGALAPANAAAAPA